MRPLCFFCHKTIEDSQEYAVLFNDEKAHIKCINQQARTPAETRG